MKVFVPENDRWGAPIRNKYEMLEIEGEELYRIRAIRDIPRWGVKAGDIGGWIECESNLLNFDDAWIEPDSKITGEAIIHSGLVGGKSHIFGDVVIRQGIIKDSIVYGDTFVDGDISILNSTIKSGSYEGYGTITDSEIENIKINPIREESFEFKQVTINSKEVLELNRKQIWKNVSLKTKKGGANWNLTITNSTLDVNTFKIYQNSIVNHLRATSPTLKLFLGNRFLNLKEMDETIVILGKSLDEPIGIKGSKIYLLSTVIEGSVALSGGFQIGYSHLKDYSSIHGMGDIRDVKLSDMASIVHSSGEFAMVRDVELTGDAVFEM